MDAIYWLKGWFCLVTAFSMWSAFGEVNMQFLWQCHLQHYNISFLKQCQGFLLPDGLSRIIFQISCHVSIYILLISLSVSWVPQKFSHFVGIWIGKWTKCIMLLFGILLTLSLVIASSLFRFLLSHEVNNALLLCAWMHFWSRYNKLQDQWAVVWHVHVLLILPKKTVSPNCVYEMWKMILI